MNREQLVRDLLNSLGEAIKNYDWLKVQYLREAIKELV